MKSYPVPVPGFEERGLAIVYLGWQGRPRLMIDGQEAPDGPKRGQYRLVGSQGQEVIAELRFQNFGVTPVVVIDKARYPAPSPVRWYGWLWSSLPLFLFLIGSFIGGLIGAIAFIYSIQVFRSDMPTIRKFFISLCISAVALLIFEGVQFLLLNFINF